MPKDQLGSCFCPVDLFSSPSLVTPRSHSSDSFGYVLCYWLGRTLPSITTHNILTQILHLPLRPAQVISATLLTSGHIKKTHTHTHICVFVCESLCVCPPPYLFDATPYLSVSRRVCVCVVLCPPTFVCECESLEWECMFLCLRVYVCVCMCVSVWSVNWTELWPDGLCRSGYLFIEQHLSTLSIKQKEGEKKKGEGRSGGGKERERWVRYNWMSQTRRSKDAFEVSSSYM